MSKKLLSSILIILFLFNAIFVNCETVYADDSDIQQLTQLTDPVYVDGVESDIDIDFSTGNIIVTGKTEVSEGTLVLEPDGEAAIEIENNNLEDESYTLDIDELSADNVDVEIYDDGELVANYDEYDEIIEDAYEGQTAIQVGVYVGATLLLYIVTSYVIVKSGITYCMAKHFTKAIEKAKAAVKEKARSYYYPTLITKVKGKNMVYIDPYGVNLNRAAAIVKANGNIYSYTASMAKKAINKAGYAAVNTKGVKNSYDLHTASGYQFKHYHRGKTASSGVLKKNGSCHSLFGACKYYK